MANAALFVGFGYPVRGRERQALQVFNETVAYYTKLQQQGELESFEPALLEAHGGDLGGFFLLRGEMERLQRVRYSDEFQRLSARASLIVESFGVVSAFLGEGLGPYMARWQAQLAELT